MDQKYNLIGIGIGVFNLSLAALADKTAGVSSAFFDGKPYFDWHSEIMFSDSEMQTSFLKDLVMGADPTNPYSFMNYLVSNGLYYSFMNTNRSVVTRREFEMYCQWVSEKLKHRLNFASKIDEVSFKDGQFVVRSGDTIAKADNICIGTGLTPNVPDFAKDFIGPKVFHAKSQYLKTLDVTGKNVVVIGGGQTGIEIFRNCFKGKWGRALSTRMISSRANLEPLDNSPFVNEYFTPNYVEEFFGLDQAQKDPIVRHQKMASDGNTPEYLEALYNDIYQLRHVHRDEALIEILPSRCMDRIEEAGNGYKLTVSSTFSNKTEVLNADIVILSTGFRTRIPQIIEPIQNMIEFDENGRFQLQKNFAVKWKGPEQNKVYAMNFSRHGHGISEPQTSLMAWRSATILNDLLGKEHYKTSNMVSNFVNYRGL
ncbi:lysine N(6)-hydroxylase/L-ornithine N(5)-oxygenase family protein [Bdellovibrio sp. HCB290]|uniref:lysine N(6)-hydroxylase/L-ornithine N(5)-oxygenase family protein n=1 Tax=Bdellovibrio sp. HCB290 TaxID=3394356 RepID=UPI0039B52BC2